MNLIFTDEQVMLRKVVKDFARDTVSPIVELMENTEQFPTEVMKKMGELGLMGITTPEKYGGSGMDFTSYIMTIHELSKISATVGVILSVHTSLVTNSIIHFGNKSQKAFYLPKLAKGEYLGAFALTEAESGSDAGSLKMKATKEEESYRLNGTKLFITNGAEADIFLVFASTEPEKGQKGITAFLVNSQAPGISIGKKEKKMGLHGSSTVEISFEDVVVGEESILGQEGNGLNIALGNLDVGRIGIAAQALGIAEAAFEHASQYAKQRNQFGKSVANNQGISFKLADMRTKIEAAKLLTYRAAYLKSGSLPCKKEASMAKLFSSQTAMEVSTEAIQIFGGYGYIKEYPVERFFRDAKVTEIYEGTSEIQRLVINKALLAE